MTMKLNNGYRIVLRRLRVVARNCFVVALVILSCISCDITRQVPEGRYFLKSNELEIDTREVNKSTMMSYMQQKPNDPKPAVILYNWASKDTGRWLRRLVGKAGQAPVAYDDKLTGQTIRNLRIEMANNGFFYAGIDTSLRYIHHKRNKRGKVIVTYRITSRQPYRIHSYDIDMKDKHIDSVLTNRRRPGIKPGVIFSMDKLDAESARASRLLRNVGYYTSTADNIHYLADTSLRSHQVDLTMTLRDSFPPERYYIRDVKVLSNYEPFLKVPFKPSDSLKYEGLNIIYDSIHFLRPSVLRKNVLMQAGQPYSEQREKQTYNHISRIGSVGRTNIRYNEVLTGDTAMLDCEIHISEGSIHGTQVGIDGTNKAGDLGVAVNLSYTHYNLFNGGERLNVKLRGAYEFVSGNPDNILTHNFFETGIEVSLNFPQAHLPIFGRRLKQQYATSTEYGIGFDIQKRPEYTRDFFSLSWKQRFNSENNVINQTVSLVDINYVLMPWMSDTFKAYLNEDINSLTRFSYDNVFTAGMGYSLIYSNSDVGKNKRWLYTFRVSAESSGNLLYGIFKLTGAEKTDDGQYNIFGNSFAQYQKGDIDFAQAFRLHPKHTIAMHAAAGVAYPYGNSTILPFEKRYFAGGPNSVRGWNTRHLGPGFYSDSATRNNPAVHVGDIRLTLSAEYRYKWVKWLEFAAFADAGNIWTIRDYENQPDGKFNWDTFYRQIALGCGVGIRLDLGFLIVRVDGGKRVYDPAEPEGHRWKFFDTFKHNSAIYLAIGYPF